MCRMYYKHALRFEATTITRTQKTSVLSNVLQTGWGAGAGDRTKWLPDAKQQYETNKSKAIKQLC